MLKHHLLQAIRLIKKDKVNFLVNLGGLILGLTAVLLSFIFIENEKGFDSFHKDKERIFRVYKWNNNPSGDAHKTADSPGLLAASLANDYPEVIASTRLMPWWDQVLMSQENVNEYADNWTFADPSFFDFFAFEMLEGEGKETLTIPGKVLLSESMARRLFGQENPIGKSFVGLRNLNYTVGGIIQDPPRKSHIQYDVIASWASTEGDRGFLDFSFMNNWLGQTVYTYVKLQEAGQAASLEAKFPGMVERYMPNRIDRYSFYLQPLTDVYLESTDLRHLRGGNYGSSTFLNTFSLIAVLILFIACFNYINISTARSLIRAKEVGVRKVFGAKKKQLMGQFLTETLVLMSVAGVLAIAIAKLFLPVLNNWLQKEIPVESLSGSSSLIFLVSLIALTSIIAGLFPAWMLSAFKPAGIIRNALKLSPGGEWPRKLLTTMQLTVSAGLIIGTIVLTQQFRYVINKDLGFDKEHVMVLNTPPGIDSSHLAFHTELSAMVGVKSVSICQASVGNGTFGSTAFPEGSNGEEVSLQIFRVDTSYLETYGMELADGRFFSSSFPADLNYGALVVNEKLVELMKWGVRSGKNYSVQSGGAISSNCGNHKRFSFSSLHESISPLVMYLDTRRSNISIRFESANLATLLPALEDLWHKYEPRYPFEYEFLDEFFADKYQSEQQMLKIISLFSILAIIIACIGLYGLTAFAISRRKKEIAVRKVLGAGAKKIVSLLTSDYIRLNLFAFLIALPVSWYFLSQWLENFAYRIAISWWVFGIAAFTLTAIVVITVGAQSLEVAMADPAKGLREE